MKKSGVCSQQKETIEIEYDDDSDDDPIIETSNECQACGGDENQEEADAWMGCNACPRWYHKYCLGEEYENLALEEMQKIKFICKYCIKSNRK